MNVKEVYFNEYCSKCIHAEKSESEDPCWDCMNQGWNIDSHKPIYFKPKDDEKTSR